MQLNYWGSASAGECHLLEAKKDGPPRKLKPIDELFIVLYRLRCNTLEKDIGDRFGISASSVSRILNTWINFLYYTLKQLPIWASRAVVNETMPSVSRHTIHIPV